MNTNPFIGAYLYIFLHSYTHPTVLLPNLVIPVKKFFPFFAKFPQKMKNQGFFLPMGYRIRLRCAIMTSSGRLSVSHKSSLQRGNALRLSWQSDSSSVFMPQSCNLPMFHGNMKTPLIKASYGKTSAASSEVFSYLECQVQHFNPKTWPFSA